MPKKVTFSESETGKSNEPSASVVFHQPRKVAEACQRDHRSAEGLEPVTGRRHSHSLSSISPKSKRASAKHRTLRRLRNTARLQQIYMLEAQRHNKRGPCLRTWEFLLCFSCPGTLFTTSLRSWKSSPVALSEGHQHFFLRTRHLSRSRSDPHLPPGDKATAGTQSHLSEVKARENGSPSKLYLGPPVERLE